jgi:hypothetical protein
MAGENRNAAIEDDPRDLTPTADNVEVVETRQAPAEAEPAVAVREEQPKPREGGKFDDKRAAIIEKIKAQRRQQDIPLRSLPVEEAETRAPVPAVERPADRAPVQVQPSPEVKLDNIPAPLRHKLKVNGREVEVDDAQMTALAQKALASDDIIGEAKFARAQAQTRLAEVERMLANQSQAEQLQPKPANAPAEDTKPATDAELDDIIDRIQTGDIKEGVEALRKFGKQVTDQVLETVRSNLGDVDARMAATIQHAQENARVQADTQRVLDSFVAENPDFSQSQRRLEVLFDSTVDVMRDNLFAIGVRPDVLQNFAQTNGLAPQAAIGFAYRKLRSEGHQLADPSVVMMDAAKRVRTEFGMPEPQREQPVQVAARVQPPADNTNFVAERIERKQAMAPQPRRANISPGIDAAPTASTEDALDQKRRQAVMQMRASRRGR